MGHSCSASGYLIQPDPVFVCKGRGVHHLLGTHAGWAVGFSILEIIEFLGYCRKRETSFFFNSRVVLLGLRASLCVPQSLLRSRPSLSHSLLGQTALRALIILLYMASWAFLSNQTVTPVTKQSLAFGSYAHRQVCLGTRKWRHCLYNEPGPAQPTTKNYTDD